MRSMLLLAFAASVASAQTRPDTATYQLRVRSVDTTQLATMAISWTSPVFTFIGAVRGTTGSVIVGPSSGTGHGTVVATLSKAPGSMSFTAPLSAPELELTVTRSDGSKVPRLVARGRSVEVVVSAAGEVHVNSRM
jgi:hypothetical protein